MLNRLRLADVLTAGLSLVVLLAAGAYLATPTRMALALDIRAVGGAAQVPAGQIVIYGEARDTSGDGVKGVKITLAHRAGRARVTDLVTTSRADGTFRRAARLRARIYTVTVSYRSGGKAISARRALQMRPGRAYLIDVRRKRRGGLALVPVRGY